MITKLSTSLATEILHRIASGESASMVSNNLDIQEIVVINLLKQAQLELLPNKKASLKKYQLTKDDRIKGGKSSQHSRKLQRNDYANRIVKLIGVKIKAVELATAYYWLRPGSEKTFSITIPNAETGLLFFRALKDIGAPDKSIVFNWRCYLSSDYEKIEVQKQWGELGAMINFPKSGTSKSLLLSTSSFETTDEHGTLKVSSRGIAQGFLRVGKQVVTNAAQR